jgi:hypothetical protein
MSRDNDPGERRNDQSDTDSQGPQQYVVFVDGIKETFERTPVKARDLIAVSQPDNADNLNLAALKGESGKEVTVYSPDENVHLDEQHRKHFDTKGDGQNYV